MKTTAACGLAGLVGALALSPSSSAAYTGLSLEAQSITSTTMVIRLYANFTAAGGTVVNVFNANISSSHEFQHNEPFGLPAAALLANFTPNTADLFDSWVSIGLSPQNNGGSTVLDPNFNGCGGCFADGSAIDNNAGWFNSNPPNNQGHSVGGKVVLAQFAFVFEIPVVISFSGALSLTSTVGTFNNQQVQGSFPVPFPSPGVLPLVVVAALAGSSRQRRPQRSHLT